MKTLLIPCRFLPIINIFDDTSFKLDLCISEIDFHIYNFVANLKYILFFFILLLLIILIHSNYIKTIFFANLNYLFKFNFIQLLLSNKHLISDALLGGTTITY